VLCDFITQGHFARHIRRMREIYAERLQVLLESAMEKLADAVEISNVEAGLQTVGWLRRGLRARQVAELAAGRQVEVVPLDVYASGRSRREGLILGFAAVDPPEVRRGVEELARVFHNSLKKPDNKSG
jgi:GntR family transcriptional regulator/MocR family aminotransferase